MLRKFRMLASAIALASGFFAGTAHAEWLEATTKHFVVMGNTTEADLRKRTLRLEQFDAAMRFLVGGEEGARVHLYLLNTMNDVQQLANNRNIGGFYSAQAQAANAFMPRTMPNQRPGMDPESILFHEYTHHMLLASTTSYIPRWATEGLAEMFMTARLGDDGSVTIGASNPSREWAIKAQHRWTIEEMLRRDTEKVSSDEMIERYSRGWALCHYLWLSGKRPGQYVEFVKALNQSGDPIKAAKQVFGDLNKLNAEVDAYLRKSAFNASKLSADQIKAPTQITVRKMTPGQTAMIGMRMISARGVDEKQAATLFVQAQPVAARYPADPMVQTWFAEMAFDSDHMAEADAAADRALADAPDNMIAMTFKGRVAARRAIASKSADDWKSARSWFLKANRADPNDPFPFELYYDSFGAAGQQANDNAVTGLFRAVMVMPQDDSLRVRAAVELIRLGEIDKARTMIAPVAYDPHGNPDNPMTKLIADMTAGKSKDDLMKRVGELKLDNVNVLVKAKPDEEDGKDAGEGEGPQDNG